MTQTTENEEPEVIVIDDSDDEKNDEDGWETVPSKRSRKKKPPQRPPVPVPSNNAFNPFMIMLVGIPGSGKSFFSQTLVNANPAKYERICQDVLKSRQRCEIACRKALRTGKTVIIDRCNFDRDQRDTFMSIAHEFNVMVDCVVFRYRKEACIVRCEERNHHETIQPRDARSVVSRMDQMFRPPRRGGSGENFRSLCEVTSYDEANGIASRYLAS
mmetsp:Transcript_7784/g.11423  ORF Transcript_7784/g.11423 Transcript_7784/m.11423 type:complete len:215 (+) Transcript_7784:83-727(+)|eukprot:CAMPEP_0197248978 /NCGR_PEP_ID=MMETSP1429-20130617/44194_1 /TAXON_ID=49237 /ORGANISM="Chaetoceros  sp., Strain UNC1202" /LENGTH=214 /DNA_ID=CAMNT_0042710359 /DNA_START=64 /DNA_END=708 /DNA_ORIENTATION=+